CRALQAVSTASGQSEQHHNPTLLTLSHHFPSLPSLNNLLFVVLVALGLILKSGGTTGSSLTTGLQPDSRSLNIVNSTTGILLLSSQSLTVSLQSPVKSHLTLMLILQLSTMSLTPALS